MPATRSPITRFILHSLWVVLPFGILLTLTWNAWRADANTRNQRQLEAAIRAADRALDAIDAGLGPRSPIPTADGTTTPPLPNDELQAQDARQRYDTGDFEGVLGSPESLRSAAGLPMRSLAALQLMRQEKEAARLAELAGILTGSMDFTTPVFLEEAERRFAELQLTPPPALAGWRETWRRASLEADLANSLDAATLWREHDGVSYLIETDAKSQNWRIRTEAEVTSAVSKAQQTESRNLADGLAMAISVGGKSLAGPSQAIPFHIIERGGWQTAIVLADEAAYTRSDARTRNFMTGVISVAGAAVLIGLTLAGRAYLRAVELARRQSEFMAAVSHEMRTPLAAMRLLAENLETGVAERASKSGEHTKLIREECERLGGLVENILAFTRRAQPQPHEAFEVSAMVQDATSLVKPLAARRGIDFEVTVSPFPVPPQGDVAALRRALLNLLDNALKHTPDGGKIVCQAFPADDESWRMAVSDSGPGIPPNERGRIFEAFYRIGDELRRTTPGTGLGLALVKRTAEAHGGRIEVDDAPGGGARFTITLPLHP